MPRLLLFDIQTDNPPDMVREVECNDIEDYYKYLNCRCFDIANRKIGNKRYDIFVDDEGLLIDTPTISAVTPEGFPMLAGNLIFALHNAEGETIGIEDEDIKNICQNIRYATNSSGDDVWVLVCEY